MVAKGSELSRGDKNRKLKYSIGYKGNLIRDQNYEAVVFQDMGSSLAPMESGKYADYIGACLRNNCQHADASKTDCQTELKGTLSWTILPEDMCPKESANVEQPIHRLRKDFYGHSGSGTFRRATRRIIFKGHWFCSGVDWPSCFIHPALNLCLTMYVDDLRIAVPTSDLAKGWELVRKSFVLEERSHRNISFVALMSPRAWNSRPVFPPAWLCTTWRSCLSHVLIGMGNSHVSRELYRSRTRLPFHLSTRTNIPHRRPPHVGKVLQ